MNKLVVVLLLVLVCLVGRSQAHTYNTSRWMKEMKNIIYDQTLLDITIPGSHDSGAYEFSDVLSPVDSEFLAKIIKLCNDLGIDLYSFIKKWSQTQNTTIYDQLNGGIRYLDLRACYIGDDWYTEHFLVGTRTQDLLSDIRRFMLENDGEVLVVELGELDPPNDELSLIQMINATIGEFLAPSTMSLNQTTIREMVRANQRIVLMYPTSPFISNFTFLWNKANFLEGQYANKDQLSEMEAWNIYEINNLGGHNKIVSFSWTLTTQDSDIVKSLLDPFDKNQDLRSFALEADDNFDAFAQKYNNYKLGNLILVDWWENSNVVNYTLTQNLRQCADDPMWVATDPTGLYCRNFFKNGDCTNPRYEHWMKQHCRLSCGAC